MELDVLPVRDGFPVVEQTAPVIANTPVNAEYMHLVVEADHAATSVRAGQFFHLLCPNSEAGAPFLRRPMSVYAADPAKHRIEFLYKVTGLGTRGLANLKPGNTLDMLGPLGQGFTLDPKWRNIVVLGRGVGLATLAPLARMAREAGVGVTAILSARKPELVMSADLFERDGATVITVNDVDRTSSVLSVETLLRELIAAGKADAFFTCGSNRLLLLMQRLGREFKIPGEVALEQQMACGLGMCFCCVREFHGAEGTEHRRVCWDGPVFPLQEPLGW